MVDRLEAKPNLSGGRKIIPKDPDLMAPSWYPSFFRHPDPRFYIAEQSIADFCKGCNNLKSDNTCSWVNTNDQARYAERKYCGGAMIDKVRGTMLSTGFKPN